MTAIEPCEQTRGSCALLSYALGVDVARSATVIVVRGDPGERPAAGAEPRRPRPVTAHASPMSTASQATGSGVRARAATSTASHSTLVTASTR